MLLVAACGEPDPVALQAVVLPEVLRPGSPIEAEGEGLDGATLRLGDPAVDVALQALAGPAGITRAIGHLPLQIAWTEGARPGEACLQGRPGWRSCVPIVARFTRQWTSEAIEFAPTPAVFGTSLDLQGDDLLLPGEGQVAVQAEVDGGSWRTVAVETRLAWGRRKAALDLQPAWLGPQPGPRSVRLRLVQTVAGQAQAGPWTAAKTLEIQAPALVGEPGGLRRGQVLPLRAAGTGATWELALTGTWRKGKETLEEWPAEAPRRLLGRPDGLVVATSEWFLSHVAPLQTEGPLVLQGTARLRLLGPDEKTWDSAEMPIDWPVLATRQVVVLEMGAGFQAGMTRLGLGIHAETLRKRVLARVAQAFQGLAVDVTEQAPHGESLRLAIVDRDPNGLELVGADSSAGKDEGNLILDEQLGRFDAAGYVGGGAAYGGVFVAGLLGFSSKLHPTASLATAEFDGLLGPYCPELGGKPATEPVPEATLRAVASLVAHTVLHEIGHALGLAAGTADVHHAGDQPGWLMEAGLARPFAERAELPGAAPWTWGPKDQAYLQKILGNGP